MMMTVCVNGLWLLVVDVRVVVMVSNDERWIEIGNNAATTSDPRTPSRYMAGEDKKGSRHAIYIE